jgi:hypothetical protein
MSALVQVPQIPSWTNRESGLELSSQLYKLRSLLLLAIPTWAKTPQSAMRFPFEVAAQFERLLRPQALRKMGARQRFQSRKAAPSLCASLSVTFYTEGSNDDAPMPFVEEIEPAKRATPARA